MGFTLPEVRSGGGVPEWLVAFLAAARRTLLQLGGGIPRRTGRAVTFDDLVDLGLITRTQAEQQADRR
jgi:hypothetical protein